MSLDGRAPRHSHENAARAVTVANDVPSVVTALSILLLPKRSRRLADVRANVIHILRL